MGIKTEIGVELYETAAFPTPILAEMFKANVIDFDVAEDCTIY